MILPNTWSVQIPFLVFAVVFCGAAVCSWFGVGALARLTRDMVDIPNDRSSHSTPTPRGGGLAVAVVSLAVVAFQWLNMGLERRVALPLVVGGTLVALIGWLDDRRSLPALVRAIVHTFAASITVLSATILVKTGERPVPSGFLLPSHVGALLAVLALVWLINLYNFMDGIDGMAGSQAVFTSVAGAIVVVRGGDRELGLSLVGLAGAALGFVYWNWMPARIFLGDVGSGYLGYFFGAVAVMTEARSSGAVSSYVWLTLLAPFVVDATLTLLRRVARGDRWYDAHRSHAYQRLVQSGWSHARVSASVVAVNVCLLPIVLLASTSSASVAAALVVLAAWTALYALVERRAPMTPRAKRCEGM
jgi:Fuc2NAc and GlcNAc transferase